ncbi:MAG: PaaI family thioesterase [Deltaproteobacteria bacterium]|nr:PaaI family thioesterase [Deltaproteobacteria bacterium]MDH4006798.1 PaaI family thioesterase [Desulfuromonadales bacterium]
MLTFVNEKVKDIPFLKTLGVSVMDITEKHAEMTVTIDERHLNYMGTVHGGLISALVDTVCFFPKPLIPSGLKLTTVDLNVSYVKPALQGDTLVARSELLHLGRRTARLSVKVTDQDHGLVAYGTATLMVLS